MTADSTFTPQPAQRMEVLAPHFFATLGVKVAAMTAAGKDIIRLDEGAPDLPPAPAIIEALSRSAALPDRHSYQLHRGTRELRQAWAAMYQRVYGVTVDPEQNILPLLGSKEGIFHLHQAYIDPGDLVLIPDPGYISYTRGTLFCGGIPHYYPLFSEQGYLPDLQAIPQEIAHKAKLMWLNYPSNPTGATATREFFAAVVDFARNHQILLCHDAAYTQVTFDGEPSLSVLSAPGGMDVAVEFNTLSKSHNMAGWRVGALVGHPDVIRKLFVLKTNADSSHFLPIMEAAIEAMQGDQGWLASRNEVYRQRRDIVVAGLRKMGLTVEPPGASLYVWAPVPTGWCAIEFVTTVLEQAQVSLTPGDLFGKQGQGFVRIALTAPMERVIEAMERLERWTAR